MQVEASQRAILHALDRLKLIGELQNDDYQLDRVKVRRFFQRASVQQIAQQAQALLQQGAPLKQVAEQIANDWGAFLRDAVQVAAGDGFEGYLQYENHESRGAQRVRKQQTVEREETRLYYRIPIDWLPESQQREAERFLQYLQSKTRESVDAYLNTLTRAVGDGESDGVDRLLNRLRGRDCIIHLNINRDIHKQLREKFRIRVGGILSEIKWKLASRKVRRVVEEVVWLFESNERIPTSDRYEFSMSRKGFVLGEGRNEHDFRGEIFIFSERACNKCDACIASHGILDVIDRMWNALNFWTYNEVSRFILSGESLPAYVGIARFRLPYAEIAPTLYYPPNTPRNILYETFERCGLSSIVSQCSGKITIRLLPFITPDALASIYKRFIPRAEARSWAIHMHSVPPYLAGEQVLPELSLTELLTDWNRHAPPEWRYTSQHAEKVFRKALRNARRAIDGAKE